ncbi:Mitochondrial carrier-like protein 2 [Oopsacas minuta]|uniref:Mitochondrial carrier-like protein 2 n=1 Tax=Oopsacas minuta TaxID=111878 RepID=A0AAV7K1L8_9METZ|nr:Mitochondrial carrier-like protein 2 [Oopsacas minuta]
MYFSTTCLCSKSIWGISLSPQSKPNKFNKNPLFTKCGSSLPLKGGYGHEPGQSAELEESNEKDDNEYYGIGNAITNAFTLTPLYQPFKVSRFLIQFGYEPVNSYSIKSRGIIDFLMNRPESTYVYLPGILGYSRGLAQKFRWGCLFAGLGPSIFQMLIDSTFDIIWNQRVERYLIDMIDYKEQVDRYPFFDTNKIFLYGMRASIIQSMGMLYSYPFFVVGNICILRCIKRQPSVWMWSVFREVWDEAGIGGFYSGILALWLYQIINLWCEEIMVEAFRLILVKLTEDNNDKKEKNGNSYTVSHFIISSITYPLSLVSNIMTANKCSARVNPILPQIPQFTSWLDCFQYLYNTNIWFRGSSLLQRRRIS